MQFEAHHIPRKGICLCFRKPVSVRQAKRIFDASPDVYRIECPQGWQESKVRTPERMAAWAKINQ